MKKQKFLLALLTGITLTISGCDNEGQISSSSSPEIVEGWSGDVAAALIEVFGSSDVIPYVEADDYLVEINYLQGTEIPYVDIYCSTESFTLVTDYKATLEADGWTYMGELDDSYHYASKKLSNLITQFVGFAYYQDSFNLFTYRNELEDTSAYAAEWPTDVRNMLDETLGANVPLPGIKATTYTSSVVTVEQQLSEEETLSFNAVSINCSYERSTMEEEYSTLLEQAGYVLGSSTIEYNGLQYNLALGQLSLSAFQFVYYAFTLETGDFNVVTFVYETAVESDVFPTEFLNECFVDIKLNAIPELEGEYSYRYYITTSEEGISFIVLEVNNAETNPFTNYDTALTEAGFTYDSENELYYITTEEGHSIVLYYAYNAETKMGSIILYAEYGLQGTSTKFPGNSFNAYLSALTGLQMEDPSIFAFEASEYSYNVVENTTTESYDFVVVGNVEEDPTLTYINQLTEQGFSYEEEFGEYAAIIYSDNSYAIVLWIKIAYDETAKTFTVTFSLSAQEL